MGKLKTVSFFVDRQVGFEDGESVLFWISVTFKVIVCFRIDLNERKLQVIVVSV